MEPVLFYGIPHGCSFGSIVALEWLGKPYRLVRIDMLAKEKDARYIEVSPLGQTPALVLEDGRPLTESLAILLNIAGRDLGSGLGFAQGTPELDRLNSMLSYLHTTFHSAFAPAWTAYKLAEDDPDREMLRALARDQAAKCYARLQDMLEGRGWLAGDRKTVADAYFIGIARWGEDLGLFDLASEYPGLHEHIRKLEADPGVVFAHAIEDGRPATSSGGFLGHVTPEELEVRAAA
ncbi:glutathione S-transferase family protein [Aquamicrobium sp. LC103]|uniref:glutathione S-transferase family protein n=1 Tax=Aquamicrobium sp. LC103 TaxID=1120658 RepID=UPI00063E9898|nr:glutathione S-transferase family protein [Aquamicrobium sp. LC103]TKT75444.1 glutathione S-transferase family protein [Aquamicrobium sp. LC103]